MVENPRRSLRLRGFLFVSALELPIFPTRQASKLRTQLGKGGMDGAHSLLQTRFLAVGANRR